MNISKEEAIQWLKKLEGQDAITTCGYGGVIFIEAGTLQKPKRRSGFRMYGTYSLFCDENWQFETADKKVIGRWTSKSTEDDKLFEDMGMRRIERIEVEGAFEQTRFYFAGGYIFTILKDDALTTFDMKILPEHKRLSVNGDETYELNDYEEDRWWRNKPHTFTKKKNPFPVTREFVQEHFPDLRPLSVARAQECINAALRETVQSISISSATTFSLGVGVDYRTFMSLEQRDNWKTVLSQWNISIDELWTLSQGETVILDAVRDKFHFIDKLKEYLVHKKLLSILFDEAGKDAVLTFSGGYVLKLRDSGRYARWGVSNNLTGILIYSHRDEGLVYRISIPTHVQEKYDTDDSALSCILYEVDYFRSRFGETGADV